MEGGGRVGGPGESEPGDAGGGQVGGLLPDALECEGKKERWGIEYS